MSKTLQELENRNKEGNANLYDQLKAQALERIKNLKNKDNAKFNKGLVTNNMMLEVLVSDYKEALGNDHELDLLFADILKYTSTTNEGVKQKDQKSETELFKNILNNIYKYQENIYKNVNKQKAVTREDQPEQPEQQSEMDDVDLKFQITSNIAHFMEVTAKGELGLVPEGTHHIDTTGKKIVNVYGDSIIDKTDVPLFPHEPSYEDVQQGSLGDCYLLSALSKIALDHPEKIRESMVDNGDGTVTVRFFGKGRKDINNPEADTPLEPVYVTVDKLVPKNGGSSKGALWVQLMERAYVASGMHIGTTYSGNILPENIDQIYEDIINGTKPKPTHFENPWLVGPDGTLKKWEPKFSDIIAGRSEEFAESLLGEDYRGYVFNMAAYYKDCIEYGERVSGINNVSEMWDNVLQSLMKKDNPDWIDSSHYSKSRSSFTVQAEIYEYLTGEKSFDPEQYVPNAQSAFNEWAYIGKIPAEYKELLIGLNSYLMYNVNVTEDSPIDQILGNKLEELRDDLKKADYSKIIDPKYVSQEIQDKIKTADQQHHIFEKLTTLAEEMCKEKLRILSSPYTGNYSTIDMKIWNALNQELQDGNMVNCGVENLSASAIEGVEDNHAYTLMGLETKEIGGKEYHFLKVRNPWGEGKKRYEPEYYLDKNGTLQRKTVQHESNGSFEIELTDFVKTFGSITINGVNPKAHFPQLIPQRGEKIIKSAVGKDAANMYSAVLSNLSKQLEATDAFFTRDSSEYKSFKALLRESTQNIRNAYGSRFDDFAGMLSSLNTAAINYREHCLKNPISNDRRDKRLNIAEAVRNLCNFAVLQWDNPAKALKQKLAEVVFDRQVEILEENGTVQQASLNQFRKNKKEIAERIANDKRFSTSFMNRSFLENERIIDGKKPKTLDDICKNVINFNAMLDNPVNEENQIQVGNQNQNENQVDLPLQANV